MGFVREDLFERYLRTVAAQLRLVEPGRRAAILAELRSHLAEAAAAEGGDADDAAFQAAVVARLGPAGRVGRELAVTNGAEPPAPLWLRAVGGIGVLLAPCMLLAAFAIRDEDLSEFMVIASQTPFIFAVPVVFQLLRHTLPRLSRLHLLLGLLAAVPLPLSVALSTIDPRLTIVPPLPLAVGLAWLGLGGVWVMLTAALAVARAARLPAWAREQDRLLGPALLGLLSGPAWLVMMLGGALGGMSSDGPPALRSLVGIAVMVWIIFNALWGLAMAVGLLLPERWLGDPDAPVTESQRPRLG